MTLPWPLFEVSVDGHEPSVVAAPTRAKASYLSFLDYADVWNCSFRQWVGMVRVKRVSCAPGSDPYEYVRRSYGLAITHGTRVSLRGEGLDLEGKLGTVVHPGRSSTAYAHVVLDRTDYAVNVHPYSCVPVI